MRSIQKEMRIRIISDPYLFWAYIVVIYGIGCGSLIVLAVLAGTSWFDSYQPPYSGVWVWSGGALLMAGAATAVAPRWWIFLILTTKGIQYKRAFHKPTYHSYTEYKYIEKGAYLHGSLFGFSYCPQYLVLSMRKLKTDELMQINNVAPSDELIKIRITKATYKKLYSILPAYYRTKMCKMFGETISNGK